MIPEDATPGPGPARETTAPENAVETARRLRLYETILSTTPDLVYIFDLQHRFTYVNQALLNMWGRTLEDSLGLTCLEIGYEPWHAEMHNREIDEVAATGQPVRGEVPFNGANGRRIYDYILMPVFDAAGKVEAVAGTTRDVTERKQEEQRVAFLSELTRKLALSPRDETLLRAAAEAVGTFLGGARCTFCECFEDRRELEILADWTPGNTGLLHGVHPFSEYGDEEWWLACAGGSHAVEDVALDPHTRARADRYHSLGTVSYAMQAQRIDARRLIILGITSDQPRVWTKEESGLLENVIARAWPLVERARLDAALNASRQRLSLVADHIPALISHVGRDHVFRFANARYAEWFGVPRSEIEGRHLRDIWGEATYSQRVPFLTRALLGETVHFEGKALHRELGWRNLQFSLVPEAAPDGTVRGLYKVGFDITDRKLTEDSLTRQSLRLRLLWEAAGILLTSDDPDGMLQQVFDTISPELGLDVYLNFMVEPSGDELELRSSRGLTPQEVEKFSHIRFGNTMCGTVARDRTPMSASCIQQGNEPITDAVRSIGLSSYVCNPLLVDDQILGTLSFGSRSHQEFSAEDVEFIETITRYVTAAYVRLKLLGSLRESDRRKDQFLATLAHELRNPLAPILTGLDVVMASRDKPEQVGKVAAMMRRQTGQMVHLIDDLLDISRITTGRIVLKKTRVNLAEVVRDAIEANQPLIQQLRHTLELQLDGAGFEVEADSHRLTQVASNLLSNAAKYTPAGGRIHVSVTRAGGLARLTVSDNGEGIDPSAHTRVFQMFEQEDSTRQDGLGIGLTLVKTLVEMHGGTISLSSPGKGRGSEFSAVFPIGIPDQPAPPVASADASAASPQARKRVMVVDDGRSAADVLAMFLHMEGMETAVAYDGLEAVERSAAFSPDLIFMDLGMPGMDGFEAARHIRKAHPAVILVALTGWGRDEDRHRASEAGFDAHAVKPVRPEEVRDFLKLMETR